MQKLFYSYWNTCKKKKNINRKSKLKRIFVVGGSQGAKIFSKLVPKTYRKFKRRSKKQLIVVPTG